MLRRFVVPFAICSCLLSSVVLVRAAPKLSELNRRLEKLKNKANEIEQNLSKTQRKKSRTKQKYRRKAKQENHLLNLIGNYRRLQQASKQRLEKLRTREKQAKKQLKAVNRRLDELEEKMGQRRAILMQRLRSIYKHGELMQTRLLFSGSRLEDFMTNYRYYRKLVNYDQDVIQNYRKTRKELEELREKRQSIFKQRREIRKNLEAMLDKRKRIIQKRKEFLNKVRNKKSFYRQRLRELEGQQRKLKNKVVRFQRQRSSTKQKLERILSQFGKQKGKLPWPVESRTILRPYGTWRENGIVHNNDGIDIKVQQNASVRSIGSGKVVFASRYQGMGKVVIIRHNKKYISLYGSLVEISVEKGESINEQQVIGRAGRSSGMDSPRLYFQIFQGKKTLNPTEWLK